VSEEDPAAAAREQMRWPSNRGRRAIAALLSARTGDVKRALRARAATSSPLVPVPENVPSGPDASSNARRSWSSRGERSFAAIACGPSRERSPSLDQLDRPDRIALAVRSRKSASCPRMCSRPFRAIRTPFSSTSPLRSGRSVTTRIYLRMVQILLRRWPRRTIVTPPHGCQPDRL